MQQRRGVGGVRANALWGRGGRRTGAAVAICVIAASLAATANAGTSGRHGFWGFNVQGIGRTSAYVPDSLASAIQQNPRQRFDVIVEGVQKPQDASQTRVNPTGLRSGMLGMRQGSTPIGTSQIGGLYRSIDGLHAGLTGQQIKFLARLPYVAAIVPNDTVQMSSWGGSNALYSNAQRWAWTVEARANWGWSSSQQNTPTIAVVDSGVDASAGAFGGRLLGQVNLTSLTPNSPGDGYGHGTFVAGIAAGAATGYAGVSPTAKLFSIDVMNDEGQATVADVVAACDWIIQNKAQYNIRVANFSLHATNPASLFFDPLDQAVEKLWLNGVTVVAASGNYATDSQESGVPFAPGNDPFVITVGAADIGDTTSTSDDTVAPWSAWGYTPDGFSKPDLSAPGRYLVGPTSPGQRPRARAAGSRRRTRLHAAERNVVLGTDGRRRGGDAARAASRLDAGPGQGRADDVRERDARCDASLARRRRARRRRCEGGHDPAEPECGARPVPDHRRRRHRHL